MAESGQLHLERLSFAEAEVAFGHVLEGLTSSYPHGDRLRMTSLVGLAEIRARRCRDVIDDVDEWLRGTLCSFALYKEAAEIAATKTDRKRNSGAGNRTIDNDIRYFEEVLQKSSVHAEVLENQLADAVRQEVTARGRRMVRGKPDLDIAWLQRLVENCCTDNQPATGNRDNGRRQQTKKTAIETRNQDNRDNRDEDEEVTAEVSTTTTTTIEEKTTQESLSSHAPVLRRRIDYDRLQEGIQRIVGGVSGDVRGQYRHFKRRVPGPAMQRRLIHELALRLSPGYRENDDLASVLEDAVQYENGSVTMARDDLESRKDLSEEILLLRTASKNWKEEEVVEIEESMEWGESWEKEEKMRRDDKDKEKEEEDDEEDEEDDDEVETAEIRLLPSAVHSTSASGVQRKCHGVTCDEGNAVTDDNCRTLSGSFTTRQVGWRVLSKSRTPDFKTGNSTGSEGGGGAGGPSGKILTLWRSTGSNRVKVDPANRPRSGPKEPRGFEEVSSSTEHGKVLSWSKSVQPEPQSRSSDRDQTVGPTVTHPSGEKVGQVVGHVVLRVGDSFRKERAYLEAHEMYIYAMGLFQRFPLPRGQTQVVADLMLRVGSAKCSIGQVAAGSRMMEESVSMLDGRGEGDAFKVAGLWFQVGNAYLADRMRKESLQARVMQLIREQLEGAEERGGQDEDKSSECDSSSSEEEEEYHSYCVCIYEALNSYRTALSVLDSVAGETRFPELAIGIAANMADCYVMTGNLDRAEVAYERALRLFPAAHGGGVGGESAPPLSLNAHVLSMLGTVSFLLGNHVRSATMYETASILLQSADDMSDEANLETAWTATMLGLSHSVLRRLDQAAVWCVRAFAAYTRFFRGRIVDVDPLNRWFIVRTLYVLGTSLGASDRALYYLHLARNMTTVGSVGDDLDDRHLVKVLTAIADVYGALDRPDKARAYYEEALEYGKGLGEKYGDDLEQVFHRQGDVKDVSVATLLKLGTERTLTFDLDKAIVCYSDIVSAFGDTLDARHDDVAGVMASLGTLCHVKDYVHDNDDDDNDDDSFLNKAERCFEEAFRLTGSTSPACVQYANFLYRRGRYADALTVMLPYVFCPRPADDEVCYSGIEQVVLPDHLHRSEDEEEEADTLVMEAKVFACFLATLCYNYLGLNRDADDALIQLHRLAVPSTKSLDHIMLGYGLMERGLFEEAAGSFVAAARLQPAAGCSRRMTFNKARLCFLMFAYLTVARAVDFLLEFVYDRSIQDDFGSTFDERRHYLRAASSRGVSSPRGAVMATRVVALRTDPEEWKTEGDVVVEKNTPPEIGLTLELISQPSSGRDLESPLEESTFEVNEKEEEEWEEWTTEETVVIKSVPEILNLVPNRNHNLNGTAYQRYDARSVPESTEAVENGRSSKPEVDVDDTPEVNGNSKDTDSTDKWIVMEEEVVDTPDEILALLRRTYNINKY